MRRGVLHQLRQLAGDRCDYCRLPTAYDPLPFQVDHIIAQQHGGETVIENLTWSCLHCHKHKGSNISGLDPFSGHLVRRFHQRPQRWYSHVAWDGLILLGRTRSARATIRVLAINHPDFVAFRAELREEGVF